MTLKQCVELGQEKLSVLGNRTGAEGLLVQVQEHAKLWAMEEMLVFYQGSFKENIKLLTA